MLGIYARQSKEKEQNLSIDDQVKQGQNKAKELGLPFIEYIDKGISAMSDSLAQRPACLKMMGDIEGGLITAIYVFDMSRLTRNVITNEYIKTILKAQNVKVHTKGGIVDVTSSNDELMADLSALINNKMVRDSAIRVKGVLYNLALAGKAHTGIMKPYGYKGEDITRNLIIDEEESKIVKDIFSLYLSGYGSGKIAEHLNDRGIATRGRKALKNGINIKDKYTGIINHKPNNELIWVGPTVLNMLHNPIYKGERLYKGETITCPSIIEQETWNLVQEQTLINTNSPGLSKHPYLLKNLCFCGRCGSAFCGRTRLSKRDHYYRCASKIKKGSGCGIRSINVDTLESVIWSMIVRTDIILNKAHEEVQKLKSSDYLNELSIQKKKLQKLIDKENSYKTQVLSLLKKDILNEDEASLQIANSTKIVRESNENLKEINLKLDTNLILVEKIDELSEFVNQWETLALTNNFDLQNAIIRMFISKIIIDFDDETEIFTINTITKIPDCQELIPFYIDSKGNPKTEEEVDLKENIISKPQKKFKSISLPPKGTMPHR
jgi:site-specific DNA recombinase